MPNPKRLRNLVLVLGDQLSPDSAAFDGFDASRDAVWMAEVEEEAAYVWSHRQRIALFFSAMRHFRDASRERGRTVHYTELARRRSDDRGRTLAGVLGRDVVRHRPERLVLVRPGDHRVLRSLEGEAKRRRVPLELREDRHFFCSPDEFDDWADGRKRLVMGDFYRWMRERTGVLVRDDGSPEGGEWSYDERNRESFGAEGPGRVKRPRRFSPDATTRDALGLVDERFGEHPGTLDSFDLPVTPAQARALLRDFVAHRLEGFGPYEDAMWMDEPFLYHSRLSAPLNLKLLDPRTCIDAAVRAYEAARAPIHSVEGFVRQIMGWREFVRGVYWREMPDYAEMNALRRDADRDVPRFFWDGETDMACVRQSMSNVLEHGYAHHAQRLMVLGNVALVLGVHPRRFHDWHMALYLDAVDWVSLPNALGMSQYGDGGIVGTKPYCVSGNYIDRMSDYCGSCRYSPREAVGDDACPITTLYWDFLARHRSRLEKNARMGFQMANLRRKRPGELKAIRAHARLLQRRVAAGQRI